MKEEGTIAKHGWSSTNKDTGIISGFTKVKHGSVMGVDLVKNTQTGEEQMAQRGKSMEFHPMVLASLF